MSFVYHPPVDFFLLATLIGNHQRLSAEPGVVDAEVFDLIAKARTRMSSFLVHEVDDFFAIPEGWTLVLYPDYLEWVWTTYPEAETISDVIETVQRRDLRSVLATMIKASDSSEHRELWPDVLRDSPPDQAWSEAISLVEQSEPAAARDRILEYLRHPQESRDRLLFVLTQLYRAVYHDLESYFDQRGRHLADRLNQVYGSNRSAFLTALKVDARSLPGPFIVHPSPLLGEWTYLVSREMTPMQPDWVIVGQELLREAPASDPVRDEIDWLTHLLGDPTRTQILRRLARRAWYGAELAQSLEISPAAISYQMTFFLKSDLVTIEKSGRRYYYSLNRDRLDDLWIRAKTRLLGED